MDVDFSFPFQGGSPLGTFHLPHSQTKNRKTAFSSLFANTHVDVALVPPIGDLCLDSFRHFFMCLYMIKIYGQSNFEKLLF